jgi:hypothetical protein
VEGLDWNIILGRDQCCLQELVVTIRSQRALGELASALCYNHSLIGIGLLRGGR